MRLEIPTRSAVAAAMWKRDTLPRWSVFPVCVGHGDAWLGEVVVEVEVLVVVLVVLVLVEVVCCCPREPSEAKIGLTIVGADTIRLHSSEVSKVFCVDVRFCGLNVLPREDGKRGTEGGGIMPLLTVAVPPLCNLLGDELVELKEPLDVDRDEALLCPRGLGTSKLNTLCVCV